MSAWLGAWAGLRAFHPHPDPLPSRAREYETHRWGVARLWCEERLAPAVVVISVDGAIGSRAASLRDVQRDPADRNIVATALEGFRLATAGRGILEGSGQVPRLDAASEEHVGAAGQVRVVGRMGTELTSRSWEGILKRVNLGSAHLR